MTFGGTRIGFQVQATRYPLKLSVRVRGLLGGVSHRDRDLLGGDKIEEPGRGIPEFKFARWIFRFVTAF